MATSNKVFVSPGVYTSERDLSFVSQSVGVTTLGIVGETLKGPAFEPIFISSYGEFETYFGGTLPEKFVNTQIPKYEAAYIAKSYLQQSNQLFVTRVLGLSGYDAGPSWSISTVSNVDCNTIGLTGGTSFSFNFTGSTASTSSIAFTSAVPSVISGNTYYNNNYVQFDGGSSSILSDLKAQLSLIFTTNSLSATSAYYFGPVSGTQVNANVVAGLTSATNVFDVNSISASTIDYCSGTNDAWFYANFVPPATGEQYYGNSFYTNVSALSGTAYSVSGQFSGTVSGYYYGFSGLTYSGYNDLVIATLRSRGITNYSASQHGPSYQVSGVNDVQLVCTGSYSGVSQNPFSTFAISGVTVDSENFTFETSFAPANSNFITKVFGVENFAKDRTEVPLFIEERYSTLLSYGYNKGFIRGLNCSLLSLEEARNNDADSIGYYLERYQTPESPWVVSELRGNIVYRLFKAITISDGNDANTEIKVSVANISFNNNTFDLIIRDFFDTDSNPVVLEKFTNCSMDAGENNYIAKKVGTSDGEYVIKSKYIMVEVNTEAPIDALPCGFEGFITRKYTGAKSPFQVFKTKYDYPGEVIYNPPFGNTSGVDNPVQSSGDNIRKTYLGISSAVAFSSDSPGYDPDFFQYKGMPNPTTTTCTEASHVGWGLQTKGFHMDSGATSVKIANLYSNSGTTAFDVGAGSFSSEPTSQTNPYYFLYSRKFTFLVQGGFDGWDIYREYRTNADTFRLGSTGYKQGALAGCVPYVDATGWGAFKQITVGDNTVDYANTDYYAYLLGVQSFANPEITNINVLVTPGIDYVNNGALVESTINVVETERADSIYICTTPDFDLLQSSTSMDNLIYVQEAVDNLEATGIDSNYTATYYPWVLTRDTVNNTQIYIPSTAEVTRNFALTDNIAFPWFATAGYTRGVVNAVRARKRLTQEDRDTLYKGRINPIATFNDVGTVIWGNKTLQIRESALDRINVRRLLLQARKLISAVAVRLLFEQNDNLVRQQFLDSVNPILDAIRRDRGLYDFRVVVQNTPEDLDANQMVGKIYIKPTKALEFIDIEFLITPTGASFENI
jgi:hypothetical protein